MSDEEFPPESEKPRYLLPDGCRDLVDVLRRAKDDSGPTSGHGSGKKLRPPVETLGPTWVAMGIAALPRYIRWLFESEKENAWLLVSLDSNWRAFVAVMRAHSHLQFQCTSEDGFAPDREEMLRGLAAKLLLATTEEEIVEPSSPTRIVFPLRSSQGLVNGICCLVLTSCFGVNPTDRLLFDVFEFD